jgi:hypothetical protein
MDNSGGVSASAGNNPLRKAADTEARGSLRSMNVVARLRAGSLAQATYREFSRAQDFVTQEEVRRAGSVSASERSIEMECRTCDRQYPIAKR